MFITAKRQGNLHCSVPAVLGRTSIPGHLVCFSVFHNAGLRERALLHTGLLVLMCSCAGRAVSETLTQGLSPFTKEFELRSPLSLPRNPGGSVRV